MANIANIYDVGDIVYPDARFGTLGDPDADPPVAPEPVDPQFGVTFSLSAPDGTLTTYVAGVDGQLQHPEIGYYLVAVTTTMPGRYSYRFFGDSGTDSQVETGHYDVKLSIFDPNPDPYVPRIEDVAALIRSKTNDGRGDTAATFTTDTRPRYDEVLTNCYLARDQVQLATGNNLTAVIANVDTADDLIGRCRTVAAMIAAALTELGSPNPRAIVVDNLQAMAKAQLAALVSQIKQAGAGDDPGPSDDELLPDWSFPVTVPLPCEW